MSTQVNDDSADVEQEGGIQEGIPIRGDMTLEGVEYYSQIRVADNEWTEEEHEETGREDTDDERMDAEGIISVISMAILNDYWLNIQYEKGTNPGGFRLVKNPKWGVTTKGAVYLQGQDAFKAKEDEQGSWRNYLLRHIMQAATWEPNKWLPVVEEVD